ncbi:MAG: hypothetical protein AAF997_04675 [Myxococcota bacterium]
MMRRGALGLALSAAVAIAGCDSGEVPQRGAFDTPATPVEKAEPRKPNRFVDTPDLSLVNTPSEGAEEAEEEGPPRDLAAELQAGIGSPAACLADYEASVATRVRVPVSATIRPSGVVIQPSAPGVGLSDEAQDCLEERATLVKLPPLEDGVSKTVTAIVEFDYTPPKVVDSDGSIEPTLKNVRGPLPMRREVAPSGRPIQEPTSRPISGPAARDPNGPTGRPVRGPKPRAIDGYQVDENSQQWR